MKRLLVVILLIIFPLSIPGECYFQQQVNYRIRVKLLPELNRLEGTESLVYHNLSPDTLSMLYFHLYLNRFREPQVNEKSPEHFGSIEIISATDDAGADLLFQVDHTIMRLKLKQSLAPQDSQKINFRFNTVLPRSVSRLGYHGDHFDVGNWYPVPAVYDRDGWHSDQHLGGEFYQEWGNYRVEISVPVEYVVAASGVLQNPGVLPDSVSIEGRKISYDEASDTTFTTYRFLARNVHDFAWTADPEFILRTEKCGEITLQFLVLPYRLEDWEKQFEVACKAVEFFQKKIGPYPYPVLTVVDGYITAGGIEYPNLVIINDMIYRPRDLSATIVHEIAHQWFYGLLANNQTRYGWMDEGFATFFENQAMEHIFGTEAEYIKSPSGFWGKYFGYWRSLRQEERLDYFYFIRKGKEEPIDRHFDWFQLNPYWPTYTKMNLVIYQLRYLLGDSLFWQGIHSYYQNWRFRHPYPRDLQNIFETVSGQNLDWFFEEWLTTTWHCDYALKSIEGKWVEEAERRFYDVRINLRRNKPIVMPLNLRLHLSDGSVHNYRIPLSDGRNFIAQPDSGIPAWLFTRPNKQVHLQLPAAVKSAKIDPEHRLLDINPFNNDSRWLPQIHWYWLHRQYLFPRTDAYTATVFPFAFFNDVDGIQFGIRTRGNFIYPDYQHRLRLLFGLRSLRPDAEFWFEHPLYFLDPAVHVIFQSYYSAGRIGSSIWLQLRKTNGRKFVSLTTGVQFRHFQNADYQYWRVSPGNISFLEGILKFGSWQSGFQPFGWEMSGHVESAFLGSDYNYQLWSASGMVRFPFFFSQKFAAVLHAAGNYGKLPWQKRTRLGGEKFYDLFQNSYLRTPGILPMQWWREGHVFAPGGGNIRALANDQSLSDTYLAGLQASLTLGNPLNLTLHYVPYVSDVLLSGFSDWAVSSPDLNTFSKLYGEGGVSVSFTRLPFLFSYFDIDQLHLDFPLWTTKNIAGDNGKFKWVIRVDFREFY